MRNRKMVRVHVDANRATGLLRHDGRLRLLAGHAKLHPALPQQLHTPRHRHPDRNAALQNPLHLRAEPDILQHNRTKTRRQLQLQSSRIPAHHLVAELLAGLTCKQRIAIPLPAPRAKLTLPQQIPPPEAVPRPAAQLLFHPHQACLRLPRRNRVPAPPRGLPPILLPPRLLLRQPVAQTLDLLLLTLLPPACSRQRIRAAPRVALRQHALPQPRQIRLLRHTAHTAVDFNASPPPLPARTAATWFGSAGVLTRDGLICTGEATLTIPPPGTENGHTDFVATGLADADGQTQKDITWRCLQIDGNRIRKNRFYLFLSGSFHGEIYDSILLVFDLPNRHPVGAEILNLDRP